MSILVFLIALGLVGEARDESPERLLEQGLALREQGKDLEALALFEKAYSASKSAQALAQVGLAEQAIGRWLDAETHVEAALATNDLWVLQRHKPLEEALEFIRDHLAKLQVLGTPEGAKVVVNGAQVGTLPLSEPVRVVAGSIVIDVLMDGFRRLSRTVEVEPRGLARESFDLVAELAAPPEPAEPAPPRVHSGPPAAPPPSVLAATSLPRAGPELTVWAIAAGGVAVAGLATGIAGTAVRAKHVSRYNDDDLCLVGGVTREENCAGERSAAKTGAAIAIAGYAAAGAFAVASVVLFVFDGDPEPAPVAFWMEEGAGIGVAGRF